MAKPANDFDLDEWSNLGNILVRMGELNQKQLASAIDEQRRRHSIGKQCQLGRVIVDMGLCSQASVDDALIEQRRHRKPQPKPDQEAALARLYAAFDSTIGATKELRRETRGVLHLKISPNQG